MKPNFRGNLYKMTPFCRKQKYVCIHVFVHADRSIKKVWEKTTLNLCKKIGPSEMATGVEDDKLFHYLSWYCFLPLQPVHVFFIINTA